MRDVATRKQDVLAALERQGSFWLATAGTDARPHVICVSAWWDGQDLVVTTRGSSRTARNLEANPRVTLAGGDPSDAIVIEADAVESGSADAKGELADGFKAAMGWDPREMDGWKMFRLRPVRVHAFRGYDEIAGREVMRAGRWLA